ncbi:MAG: 3-deoxy-manno-octulosonate cytidylyltransferase [Kiritimatiellae bacterium]|jgi:3-deoxy-manno-octulosonate cytidylyltransferase (CMP-KDO synthetase)|nr:3-deoxy-manno-octulosonate cytidylyltransferase [Kiritimatiellia bacterium]
MSKIAGVIPARWASTRLPGKSLVNLCGRPMICHVVERVKQAKLLDYVVVATDDQRIIDAIDVEGVECVMTAVDHPSGTDRVAEAVSKLDDVDIIINIQGDEPLINPQLIDLLAEKMVADSSWDMATAVTPIKSEEELNNPSVVKAVFAENAKALYFSRAPIPFNRDDVEFARLDAWRHLGIYAYTKDFLETLVKTSPCMLEKTEKLEQLRALHIGCNMLVVQTEDDGVGVDTPEDVAAVENLMKQGK